MSQSAPSSALPCRCFNHKAESCRITATPDLKVSARCLNHACPILVLNTPLCPVNAAGGLPLASLSLSNALVGAQVPAAGSRLKAVSRAPVPGGGSTLMSPPTTTSTSSSTRGLRCVQAATSLHPAPSSVHQLPPRVHPCPAMQLLLWPPTQPPLPPSSSAGAAPGTCHWLQGWACSMWRGVLSPM